jgi:site-specific DNA recombinase
MTLKAGDIRQLLASTSTVKRVIGYIRVSSDEQAQDDRWSIPAQKRAIEEGCTRRGWVIVGWVYDDDSAHSDSIAKRPGLKGLMEAVENGTLGADAIVVHSLDRWARNVLVMLGTLAILGKKNIGWLSTTTLGSA